MTNQQIIDAARVALMDAGKIGSTGRMMEYIDGEGQKHTMPEPEPIHTFNYWKERGYSVIKGEKAVIKLTIWKHTERKCKVPEDANADTAAIMAEPVTCMFMKTSAFFSLSQVQPIKEA
ncbi:MAG: hypothetical protein IKO83_04940 [Oscillospiraceae bacterium]|nr:hypothetical protein [Oscillospiraceae bacterium]